MRMIIIFVVLINLYIYNSGDMKYKTKHRDQLINYLKANSDKHLSIIDIQNDLKDIPQATLYRLMDSLVKDGVVRKYIVEPSRSSCYQYAGCEQEHQHFHLLCEKCGKLIHLECDEVNHLFEHIKDEHGFAIDVSKVNLYGLCDECRKNS